MLPYLRIHNQMIVQPCLFLDLLFHILEWTSALGVDVPDVRRPWYGQGRDLFQYHPRGLHISAGEVHMVCFDLEIVVLVSAVLTVEILDVRIVCGGNAYMSNTTCQ